MLPHALPGATWEFQGRGVDQHGKEWLCGKEVCQMLKYREEITKKRTKSRKVLYVGWILRTTKKFFLACFFDTLCINHTPISPATKTIKAHECSATNPTALPNKHRMAPTTLPTMAGMLQQPFLQVF